MRKYKLSRTNTALQSYTYVTEGQIGPYLREMQPGETWTIELTEAESST